MCGPPSRLGIPCDVDPCERVLGGAPVDEPEVVLDVGVGADHFALGELVAEAGHALTGATVARRAVAVDELALGQWTGGLLGLCRDRSRVHECPHRQQRQRSHRPVRHLATRLVGSDDGKVGCRRFGLRGRRCCSPLGWSARRRGGGRRRRRWSRGPTRRAWTRRHRRRHRHRSWSDVPGCASEGVRGFRSSSGVSGTGEEAPAFCGSDRREGGR